LYPGAASSAVFIGAPERRSRSKRRGQWASAPGPDASPCAGDVVSVVGRARNRNRLRLSGGAGAAIGAACGTGAATGAARGTGAGEAGRVAEQERAAGSTEGMDAECLLGWDVGS